MATWHSSSRSLLHDFVPTIPRTEGIKYAGSKLKLLPYILQLAEIVNPRIILDGFSGTTRVSQAFAQIGKQVIANDISAWSKMFGICYLTNPHSPAHFQELIAHFNGLPGEDGWFTQHYGGYAEEHCPAQNSSAKRPWQIHNTRKLDAIRSEMERLTMNEYEKAVVLTSLMLAMDAVDNTIGHYVAYLNKWSPRSYQTMKMAVPNLIHKQHDHQVYQADIFDVLPKVKADLAYYDPPYGSNNEKMPPSRVRYAAYYHVWTSVCLNDEPALFGKANRRVDSSDNVQTSVFEEFRRSERGAFIAVEAIQRLLRETPSRYIILSYSSGGRATAQDLYDAIDASGRLITMVEVDHRRNIMAAMRWTHEWTRNAEQPNKELLFLLEK